MTRHVIATIGANPLPVVAYCRSQFTDLTRVTLIASPDSHRRAERVKAILKAELVSIVTVDPFDFEATTSACIGIQSREAEFDVIYSGGTQLMAVAAASAFPNATLLEAPYGGADHLLDQAGECHRVDLAQSLTPLEVAQCHDIVCTSPGWTGIPQGVPRAVRNGLLFEQRMSLAFARGMHALNLRPMPINDSNKKWHLDSGRDFQMDLCFTVGARLFAGSVKSTKKPTSEAVSEVRSRSRHLGGLHARAFMVTDDVAPLAGGPDSTFGDVSMFSSSDICAFAEDPNGSDFGTWVEKNR